MSEVHVIQDEQVLTTKKAHLHLGSFFILRDLLFKHPHLIRLAKKRTTSRSVPSAKFRILTVKSEVSASMSSTLAV